MDKWQKAAQIVKDRTERRIKTISAAGAKEAAHGAARLAGEAQAPAVAVLHDHAFHAVAVCQAQQLLYGLFVFQPP